jgi:hypothetical protein
MIKALNLYQVDTFLSYDYNVLLIFSNMLVSKMFQMFGAWISLFKIPVVCKESLLLLIGYIKSYLETQLIRTVLVRLFDKYDI